MASVDPTLLAQLEPISTLSPGRLKELAGLCFIEKVSKNIDPFRMNVVKNAQAMYLLKGDLGLRFSDGSKRVLRSESGAARHPIDNARLSVQDAIALTEIEIVRIDLDLLDIMMTWDQLSGYGPAQKAPVKREMNGHGTGAWMNKTSAFSAGKLQSGVFSRLPPANIEEMFRRMSEIAVKAGQTIITQGAEGDYYYLIEEGVAEVSRMSDAGSAPALLAELHAGDAFGEEALVSDNKRNATVTMKTDGRLLRLNKADFIELLKAPLLNHIGLSAAKQLAQTGAIWMDVRFASEYQFGHIPGAINVPLNEIRNSISELDQGKQYIVYCQTGRRSSAAAFILAQHGFQAQVLEGGVKASSQ
jgi:rhodanese-related sulfurtransferase